MSGNEIKRRDFLKFMGLGGAGAATLSGCDMPTTVTLEEGKEKVVSYVAPEEYVIPGIGVWYASVCQQCAAGCGVHGRVREGRLLKLEGNPDSAVSAGGLCQMGQAGLQAHYNPDRLTKPKIRKGGVLADATWDEVLALIEQKIGSAGVRTAWFTGAVSGHQAMVLNDYLAAIGSDQHYVYEFINNSVGEAVNKATLGEATPRYDFAKAKSILSFGADFLGTWLSPVHFSHEYVKFRTGDRGVLMVVEPKMTLTGANADVWAAVRPGTEGVVALGIANLLITKHQVSASRLPAQARSLISSYSADRVAEQSGVTAQTLEKMATFLKERSPSLVLSGASAHGHANGYQNAAAAMLLNILLGNVGSTIQSAGQLQLDGAMVAATGNTRALTDFAEAAAGGRLDAAFIYNTNPVFTAPDYLKFEEALDKVPFKVALSMFEDETTAMADVVLPLASSYEDWGTSLPGYRSETAELGVQQPLMEPLYPDTKGFGDILLALLKGSGAGEYATYPDYYAYLKSAFARMPASVKGGVSDDEFWAGALQHGKVAVNAFPDSLSSTVTDVQQPDHSIDADYPMHLVPSARLGLWDGRHANLSWLQEAPDQISKVFWDSWVELHPKTAARIGVKEGDYVRVESSQGAVEAQVYVYRGVHPDVVAIPIGQGHKNYGRYATNVGVNPLKILNPGSDEQSGEMVTHSTRVRISKTGKREDLARLGGSERQLGRRLVGTVSADVFRRTEGGDGHVA